MIVEDFSWRWRVLLLRAESRDHVTCQIVTNKLRYNYVRSYYGDNSDNDIEDAMDDDKTG